MICKRCVVTGRVQGVFYRASTRTEALRLGITGHARNLADGGVEVLACGEPAAVDALIAWLWKGPSAAVVRDVTVEEVAAGAAPPEFTTG